MKRAIIALALLAAVPAHAATYFIDIVRPVTVPGFIGPSPDFVQGTITTDCNNCVLVKSDILDWDLTIAAHSTPSASLNSNNSFILFGGSNQMIATPSGLFFEFVSGSTLTFDDTATNGGTTLQLFQASSGLPIIGWEIANGTGAFINPTNDLIGTAVPEPSTWALLLLGFMMLAVVTRRGMGPCAAREPTADGRKQQPVPAWSCGHE